MNKTCYFFYKNYFKGLIFFLSPKIGHRMQHLSEGTKGWQVGSGGDGERWGSDRGSRGSLNEQIALVLMRLQEDMQNVLQRLHKLEAGSGR